MSCSQCPDQGSRDEFRLYQAYNIVAKTECEEPSYPALESIVQHASPLPSPTFSPAATTYCDHPTSPSYSLAPVQFLDHTAVESSAAVQSIANKATHGLPLPPFSFDSSKKITAHSGCWTHNPRDLSATKCSKEECFLVYEGYCSVNEEL